MGVDADRPKHVDGCTVRLSGGSGVKAGQEATLTFQPGDITHIRTYPFWQVTVGKRKVYVDQLGKLYGKFLPSIPGD